MDSVIKFIPDTEIIQNGLIPLLITIFAVIIIIIITIIFVKNEIKGVKKMKKIKILLLTTILILPSIVKADMAAPMSNYKVRISNSNGAYLYEYDSNQKGYVKTEYKIEYDKIVKITYEMIIDDQAYGGYVCADEEQKKCGYINLSNTSAIDINLDDYYHEFAKSYYVFDETCYLYKGPSSNLYSMINPETSLDVGYTFTSNYYDDLWTYVPEKKAWVYTYTYNKYSKGTKSAGVINTETANYKNNIITMEEVKIYDNPKTKENVLATIPANTKLTTIYSYSMEPHYPYYYITYNGVTGFIETIYDNEYYAITNVAYEVSDTSLKVSNNDGIKLYKDGNLKSEVIATIPTGTELKPNYALYGSHTAWMYKVEYDNQVGWIEYNYENFNSSSEENIPDEITDDLVEDDKEETIITDDSDTSSDKISISGTITMCIIVVILISLTAFVSIFLQPSLSAFIITFLALETSVLKVFIKSSRPFL